MASILNVDQINNAAGTSAIGINSSSGLVTFPNSVTIPNGATMPAGSVVQIVHATPFKNGYTANQSYLNTTSTSFTDMSGGGHYVEITPTSSSSKIMVMATFPSYNSGAYTLHKMMRNNTGDGLTYNLTGVGTGVYDAMSLNATGWGQAGFNWLDTPNSTSLLKYKIFMKVTSGTGYIGWTSTSATSNDNLCSYTAVEIAQ